MSQAILHQVSKEAAAREAAELIASKIIKALTNQEVLLLLSGGSAAEMTVELANIFDQNANDLSKLTVTLLDERYVPVGHPDSNEQQLKKLGIIDSLISSGAIWFSYLQTPTTSGQNTASAMASILEKILLQPIKVMAVAGMGDDAHTAGLLPTSDTQTITHVFKSKELVEYYHVPNDATNPYRERLTVTPYFMSYVDQVFLYTLGNKKAAALERFFAHKESIENCPVISLYRSRLPVEVLTDISLPPIRISTT